MGASALSGIKYQVTILSFLGGNSFEIFLVHYPFVVYYIFFNFGNPWQCFFAHGLAVILLDYALRKASQSLNKIFLSNTLGNKSYVTKQDKTRK